MLSIENPLLKGNRVSHRSTPNRNGPMVPEYLVMHYTAGSSSRSATDWLCDPAAKASAHVVLGRDGEINQLAPFNVATWRAGVSPWAGLTGVNDFSIGIEMDNAGVLRNLGDRFESAFGNPYPQGVLAVIGPGTDLGVAGVVQTAQGWKALPGEGGHATLAATDEHEAAVLAEVRRHFEHVSTERLLSGIGLPVLHGRYAPWLASRNQT